MFLDDEFLTSRIRARRASSFLWIAATALAACIAMMAGLLTAARAEIAQSQQIGGPVQLNGVDTRASRFQVESPETEKMLSIQRARASFVRSSERTAL